MERLDVPNDFAVLRKDKPKPRVQLVTNEAIEEALLPHTVWRFRQHKDMPFGHGERSNGLGQTCSTPDFHRILDGTYNRDLDQLTDEAREWIHQLKCKDFVTDGNQISTMISVEDWISGWMKMRESTASAPGGHYGHYKTAATVARLHRLILKSSRKWGSSATSRVLTGSVEILCERYAGENPRKANH